MRFKKELLGFFLGIVVFVLVWFIGLPGLAETGSHAAAIALLTAIWWIFMVMPPMIPALFSCVLFFVTGTVGPMDAFSGFFNPTIWLLFFALIIAKGVDSSGLGKRIATIVLSKVPLSFNGVVLAFIILCFVFPFVIPSAAADVALLMTFAIGILDALGVEKSSKNKISAGLTCFIAILTLTFGRVPLTGSLANFLASGFVNDLAGISIGWLEWLKCMWVIAPLPAIGTYFYITRVYKPEQSFSAEMMRGQIQKSKASLGELSIKEKKAAIFVALAVIMWVLDAYIPLSSSQVGILVGMLFLLPYVGFLTLKDFNSISLITFFFAGGSYSIGKVLTETGFAEWAGNWLMKFSFLNNASFFTASVFVLLFAFVLHFLLETLGEVSLLAPIILQTGILPAKAAGMLITYGAGMYLFPFQSTVIVLGLGFETAGWSDIVKYGCFLSAIALLQGVLFLSTYWAWVLV